MYASGILPKYIIQYLKKSNIPQEIERSYNLDHAAIFKKRFIRTKLIQYLVIWSKYKVSYSNK